MADFSRRVNHATIFYQHVYKYVTNFDLGGGVDDCSPEAPPSLGCGSDGGY